MSDQQTLEEGQLLVAHPSGARQCSLDCAAQPEEVTCAAQ